MEGGTRIPSPWAALLGKFSSLRADALSYFFDKVLFQRSRPRLRALGLKLTMTFGLLAALKNRNRYHIRRHMRKAHTSLVSYPKLLHVEMSTHCNIRCRMCSIVRPGRTRTIQHFDMEVLARLEPVLPFVTDTKMHGGGEPFLNPDIEKVMLVFQRYGVKLNTVTNGTVINDRLARLIGKNFSTLTVSIDGATAATYELVRERAKFDRVMHSLDLLNRYRRPGFRLILGFVILRCNAHELPDMVRLAKRKGAQELQAAWVVPFADLPWSQEQDPTREPERMNRHLRETYEVARELDIALKLPPYLPTDGVAGEALRAHRPEYHQLHPTNDVEGVCQLMYDRAMVLVDGTIKPCGQSRTVADLGSLKDQPFEAIWSGPGYRRLRQTFNGGTLPVTCRSCNFIRAGQLGMARLVLPTAQGVREPLMHLEISR